VAVSRITVVGAGNVGATAAQIAAGRDLGNVVLIDIIKGFAEGKALDMSESAGVYPFSGSILGTTDWQAAADSDIVIITSGLPRKPGMSRDDLLAKNVQIVKAVSEQVVRYCPEAFVIVVCNPLDAMVYTAGKVTGFAKNKVMGMAGALDSARFACFIAAELGVSVGDVAGVLMGGHGDDMVPLARYTSVAGIPLGELMDGETIERLIQRTRNGGIEIVNLVGYSAYYAPAAGAVKMAEAIIKDKKAIMSCCAWCEGQYGIGGAFVGVPVVLGAGGVERVVELKLDERERRMLDGSVEHVRQLVEKVDGML
jgi:malate dehydrogenase